MPIYAFLTAETDVLYHRFCWNPKRCLKIVVFRCNILRNAAALSTDGSVFRDGAGVGKETRWKIIEEIE